MAQSKTPFTELAEVLRRMTPTKKLKLIESHRSFVRLRSLCEAKGYIETLKGLSGIKVLKRTKEVKELKKVIDILKPGGFKWEDDLKKD